MQTIYATDQGSVQNLYEAEKMLRKNLKQTTDLFFYQLLSLYNIAEFSIKYIEILKSRHIKINIDDDQLSKISLHPFIMSLKENEYFNKYIKDNKLKKIEDEGIIRELYKQLYESEFYSDYLKDESNESEKEILTRLYKDIMLNNERYQSHLDENFTYFEEDNLSVKYRLTDLLENPEILNDEFFEQLYNKSDLEFATQLLDCYRDHHEEFDKLVEPQLKNWDIQRIARLDIILIKMALCELLYFEYIPVKVSINEYIDISKLYSTPKSHEFVNGVTDKLRKKLEKEKKIKKSGRGLLS